MIFYSVIAIETIDINFFNKFLNFEVYMKKTLFSGLFAIFAIAMVIGVYSCKNDTVNPGPTDMMTVNQVVPDATMNAFDANEFTVYGDLTNDLQVYPQQFVDGCKLDDRRPDDKGGMGGMKDRMGPGFKLRMLLWDLKLTKEQMTTIGALMPGYHECVRSIMQAGEADRQAAMAAARAARADVLAKYKIDGDKAAARTALNDINKTLKAALDASIDKDALCNCLKNLYLAIRETLTPAQQIKFDAWVAKQKLPCMRGVDTPPNRP